MTPLDELRHDAAEMTLWQQHRFFVLIAGVITLSFLMVCVSLNLYNSSGAAQVDLSRPGYQSIQREASRGNIEDSFPSTGKLDAAALDQFDTLLGRHAKQVVGTDSFDPTALDLTNLQLVTPSSTTETE